MALVLRHVEQRLATLMGCQQGRDLGTQFQVIAARPIEIGAALYLGGDFCRLQKNRLLAIRRAGHGDAPTKAGCGRS
ncbi:MAG TPA: hypothetical protein VFB96_06250 [Pirellulaceae bacterium]|nr:hypothetical protein [Pirellulaceae bacterium]